MPHHVKRMVLLPFLIGVCHIVMVQLDETNHTSLAGPLRKMCPPGSYNKNNCSCNGAQDECEPCPSGFYQPSYNLAHSCEPCKTECPGNYQGERMIIVAVCTRTSNIKCECKDGYWLQQDRPPVCISISGCPPGEGVQRLANAYDDTICEQCRPGYTFSNVSSVTEPCRNCTVCSDQEFVVQNCTSDKDTECRFNDQRTVHILKTTQANVIKATAASSSCDIPVWTRIIIALLAVLVLGEFLYIICRKEIRLNERVSSSRRNMSKGQNQPLMKSADVQPSTGNTNIIRWFLCDTRRGESPQASDIVSPGRIPSNGSHLDSMSYDKSGKPSEVLASQPAKELSRTTEVIETANGCTQVSTDGDANEAIENAQNAPPRRGPEVLPPEEPHENNYNQIPDAGGRG